MPPPASPRSVLSRRALLSRGTRTPARERPGISWGRLLAALLPTALLPLTACAPPAASGPFNPDEAARGLALGTPVHDVTPAWTGLHLPFPAEEHPWAEIRSERIGNLLGSAMERAEVDAWLLILRENNNDPLAHHVGGENAGGTAVFLFFREGGTSGVNSVAVSPAGDATALRDLGVHDTVVVPEGEPALAAAVRVLRERNPGRIAVNSSALAVADGLSHTQRRELEAALGAEGEETGTKIISVEEMAVITSDGARWLIPPQEELILIPSR